MEILSLPIEQIIPYARNPRNNQLAVNKVATSIKEFGWQQPIVVDKDMVVIAGHTRLLAARALDLKFVPVHIAKNLRDAQAKAYRIADNRTHEESSWDNHLLKTELEELKDIDFDLDITAFNTDEIAKLLATESQIEEDLIIEAPKVSKPGDLWILGEHKLLCADALKKDSYKILLESKYADLVFTDPPYNVNYSGRLRDRASNNNGVKVTNDNLQEKFYEFLYTACQHLISHCQGAIYICTATSEIDILRKAFRDANGHWSTFIIWVKNHFALSTSDYQKQYESILYGWPKNSKRFWCGARNMSDVWFFDKSTDNKLHPTMKPIDLISQAIENSSKAKDIVLDVFGGAGSTLIACEKIGRTARIMELEPHYCDVSIQRWQNLTGKKAVLSASSKTFEDIAEES